MAFEAASASSSSGLRHTLIPCEALLEPCDGQPAHSQARALLWNANPPFIHIEYELTHPFPQVNRSVA
jgi:hypothetical protein